MVKVPVPLTVPPVTFAPADFSTGIGSPVTIDSSTLLALRADTVNRHFLARPDAEPVADNHAVERNVLFVSVRPDRARRLGASPSKAFSALLVWLLARNSST